MQENEFKSNKMDFSEISETKNLTTASTMMMNSINILSSSSDSDQYYSTLQKILIGIAMSMISLFTIFGNMMAIYIYNKGRNLPKKRPKNTFLLFLATADFMIGLVSINTYTVLLIVGHWPFGKSACYVWLILDHLIVEFSNFTIVAIALDRSISVLFPMQYRTLQAHYRRYDMFVLILVSFIAISIGCVFVFAYDINTNQCKSTLHQKDTVLTLTMVTLTYFLPVLAICVAYILIGYKMTRRCNDIYVIQHTQTSKRQYLKSIVTNSTRRRKLKNNRHNIEYLLLVSVLFILMWMPYSVAVVVLALCRIEISVHVWKFCYIFGWINSAVNPICYVLGNREFRLNFLNILDLRKRRKFKKKNKLNTRQTLNEDISSQPKNRTVKKITCTQEQVKLLQCVYKK